MASWHNEDTNELCRAILSLKTVEECYAFFDDALTIKEAIDIAQRLKVAKMLAEGVSYNIISKETKVSTATISRVSKCLEYGNGGYKTVLDRLK